MLYSNPAPTFITITFLNIKDNKQITFMYRFTITLFSDYYKYTVQLAVQFGISITYNVIFNNIFGITLNQFLNMYLLKPLITT